MKFYYTTFLLFFLLLMSPVTVVAQSIMEIDTTFSPQDLVKKVLLQDKNLSIGNIQFTGHEEALGYFHLSNPDMVVFDKGIILSTGKISSATGPNSSPQRTDELHTKGNKDLSELCHCKTHDAAVLEFDFIPTSNKVAFEYIFASEEYPEYTGSEFNDIFAFFISGPAIEKPKNMATLPRRGEVVSINTINKYKNEDLYIRNNAWKLDGKIKADAALKRMDVDLLNSFEFDGMTAVLTAETNVIPFKKYHFKIAIADVNKKYNSAVFLKGGAFQILEDTTANDIFSANKNIDKSKVDFEAIMNDQPFDIAIAVQKENPKEQPQKVQNPKQESQPTTQKPKKISSSKPKEQPSKAPKSQNETIQKVEKHQKPSVPSKHSKREKISNPPPIILSYPADFEAVYFATGSYELSEYAERMLLYNLIPLLKDNPKAFVILSGHTDAIGDGSSNIILSKNRVESVGQFLKKNGLATSRIVTTFHGASSPATSNSSERGRSRNRRVNIRLEKIKTSIVFDPTKANSKPPKILGDNPPFTIQEDIQQDDTTYLLEVPQLVIPSKFESIYFENNSAKFSLKTRQLLEIFVAMLKKTPNAYVELSGHTDKNETVVNLDEKRAKATANFFKKNGIAENQFFMTTHSSSQPASNLHSSKGESLNRRVEIIITKKE